MGIFDHDKHYVSLKKPIVQGMLLQLAVKARAFITLPIITAYILPEDLGIYSYIAITASLLTPYFILNLIDGPAVLIIQEDEIERRKNYYVSTFNSVMCCFIVSSAILYGVSKYYGLKISSYFIWIILIIFIETLFRLVTYVYAMFQNFPAYVRYSVTSEVLVAIITILLAIEGYGFKSFIIGILIGKSVTAIIASVPISRELVYSFDIDKIFIKKAVKLSLVMLPIFSFTFIIDSSDFYFLMKYFGPEKVGIYKIAYTLSAVVLSISALINFFWTPVSSKLWTNDRELFKRKFAAVSSYTILFMIVISLFYEINSSIIYKLFVRNNEYHGSRNIVALIVMAMSIKVYLVLITGPLYADRRARILASSYLLGACLNLALNYYLIPVWDIRGAAVSTVISYGMVGIIMSLFCQNSLKLKVFESRIYLPVITYAVIWVYCYIRPSALLLDVIVKNIIYLLMTCVLLIIFSNREEKELFNKKIMRSAI